MIPFVGVAMVVLKEASDVVRALVLYDRASSSPRFAIYMTNSISVCVVMDLYSKSQMQYKCGIISNVVSLGEET